MMTPAEMAELAIRRRRSCCCSVRRLAVYLARQDLSAQQVEELTAKLSGVIAEAGGKITKTEYWGMKSLNYRIRKNRKALFLLTCFDSSCS